MCGAAADASVSPLRPVVPWFPTPLFSPCPPPPRSGDQLHPFAPRQEVPAADGAERRPAAGGHRQPRVHRHLRQRGRRPHRARLNGKRRGRTGGTAQLAPRCRREGGGQRVLVTLQPERCGSRPLAAAALRRRMAVGRCRRLSMAHTSATPPAAAFAARAERTILRAGRRHRHHSWTAVHCLLLRTGRVPPAEGGGLGWASSGLCSTGGRRCLAPRTVDVTASLNALTLARTPLGSRPRGTKTRNLKSEI